jgi:hypothetical protein
MLSTQATAGTWATAISEIALKPRKSVFRVADILEDVGSRVTATPTTLGEWRSQLRDAGAATYSDTNGNPNVQPSAADGIYIYDNNAWAAIDTTGEPTRYEIFIGKNKNYWLEVYGDDTGRNGSASLDRIDLGTQAIGTMHGYNPTTGVFYIMTYISSPHSSGSSTCSDETGIKTANCYFDVIVEDRF